MESPEDARALRSNQQTVDHLEDSDEDGEERVYNRVPMVDDEGTKDKLFLIIINVVFFRREAEGVDERVDESIENGGVVSNGEDSRSSSALSHNVETRNLRGSVFVCLSENRENLIPRSTQSSWVDSSL